MDLSRREFVAAGAAGLAATAILPSLQAYGAGIGLSAAEPLKVGIVGCGRQGRVIITELQKIDGVTIIAVCDTDQTRADNAAKRVNGATAYSSVAAMLDKAKDLNAVIIATPTHLHKEPALAALQAGKHVYCEAPLAHSIADAKAIAAGAAAATKAVFAVGFEGRSNPIYKLARSFYRSESVKDSVSIEATQNNKTTWRFPGTASIKEQAANWRLDKAVSLGLAGEWGSQAFDVAMWYTDKVPVSVRGRGSIRVHSDGREVADTVACELTFADGLAMQYTASLCNSYLGRYELFRGSNAAVKLAWTHGWMFKEADAPTQGWEVYANRQQFHNDEGITLIAGATKLAEQGKLKDGIGLPYSSTYYGLWEFVSSITTNKPPTCDAAAALRATAISIAAAQAVATNSEIQIDPATLKV